jgi:uncharacterized protein with HEPN domain
VRLSCLKRFGYLAVTSTRLPAHSAMDIIGDTVKRISTDFPESIVKTIYRKYFVLRTRSMSTGHTPE